MAQEESRDRIATDSRKSKPGGLLDLASELWSRIGIFVIDDGPLLTSDDLQYMPATHNPSSHTDSPYAEYTSTHDYKQPAITRTCTSFRDELLPYYYATQVSITLGFSYALFHNTGKWLRAIRPANRSHLKEMRVKFTKRPVTRRAGREVLPSWIGTLDQVAFRPEVERVWRIEVELGEEIRCYGGKICEIMFV